MDKNTTVKISKQDILFLFVGLFGIVMIFLYSAAQDKIDKQGLTPSSPGIYTSIDPLHPNRTIIVLDTGDARQALLAREAGLVLNQWGINPALQGVGK